MSGSPLGVSLLSRILVPWAIILIALQSLQLKFLLILWVCVLVLISVQQISLKLSGSTLYQSLIVSHSYYSQELRSHSAGWFSPRVSHKVTARWWLWLGSSQMLLYSHIWYLAWEDSNHWELGSPGTSLPLCNFSIWLRQRGGFRLLGLLTGWLRAPKIHISQERKGDAGRNLWHSLGNQATLFLPHSVVSEVKSLSRVQLFATLWTIAHQAPPSIKFSRQEYWSGLPFPSPGDLPDPGAEPGSPTLQADALLSEPLGKPHSGGLHNYKSPFMFKEKKHKTYLSMQECQTCYNMTQVDMWYGVDTDAAIWKIQPATAGLVVLDHRLAQNKLEFHFQACKFPSPCIWGFL